MSKNKKPANSSFTADVCFDALMFRSDLASFRFQSPSSLYLEIIDIGALPTSCQLQVNG